MLQAAWRATRFSRSYRSKLELVHDVYGLCELWLDDGLADEEFRIGLASLACAQLEQAA